MGFSYREGFKLAPGIRVTASKRGLSASAGPKGMKVSANTRQEKRVSLGWKGLFWRKKV